MARNFIMPDLSGFDTLGNAGIAIREMQMRQQEADRRNRLVDMQIQKYLADQQEVERQQGLQQALFQEMQGVPRQLSVNVPDEQAYAQALQQWQQSTPTPLMRPEYGPESDLMSAVGASPMNYQMLPDQQDYLKQALQARPAQDVYRDQGNLIMQAIAKGLKPSTELDNFYKMMAPKEEAKITFDNYQGLPYALTSKPDGSQSINWGSYPPETFGPLERTKVGTEEVVYAKGSRGTPKRLESNTPKIEVTVPGAGSRRPPTAAFLKEQNEILNAIGTVSSINANLGAVYNQIDTGKLQLGPILNKASEAMNYTGMSSENSRNYASAVAQFERMRNDSLRLNKGVQTEGDAVRAWNELFANLNDPDVVKQRIVEIQNINAEGARLQQEQLEIMRSDMGMGKINTAPFKDVKPGIGTADKGNKPRIVERRKGKNGMLYKWSDGQITRSEVR